MKKGIAYILFFSFLFSCGHSGSQAKSKIKADTLRASDEADIDLKKMREDYIVSYDKPIVFESQHKGKNGEQIKVNGKYYCLFDSSIIVPGKYNLDDTTKTFRTHNFAEYITIIIDGDTAIRKTITKQIFENTLPTYLKDYAVLHGPQFEGYNSEMGTFDFNFSISVPLSDVGEARKLTILKSGQMKVSNPE